ncbi:carbohydrate-binding module family 18 protein, partial [Macroventuria anomochaeta]
VSLDGACGGVTGKTCSGSTFGSCCSEYGYCGSGDLYCTGACQPTFGTCDTTPAKRSAPKGNLRAAPFAAVKRSTGQKQNEKRAIGGAGPDYTYPPIPRTTITSTATQTITFLPTTGGTTTLSSVVVITTVWPLPGSTATTTTTVLVPVTTETFRSTQTVCPTST